jgi:folate-binding protein YgfZ
MMKQSILFDGLPPGKVAGPVMGRTSALSFGDTEAEFRAAREGSAVTDSSMFGRIEVTGRDRLDLLHRLSTNSVAGLKAGSTAATVFVTDKGRVIDRVLVYAREDSLLLVTSPEREELLTTWIDKYTITENIRFRTITGDTAMLSLLGSRMVSTFMTAAGNHPGGAEYAVVRGEYPGTEIAHVISPAGDALSLAGIAHSLPRARWIGSLAYDAFRIFSGIPASPGELNDGFNPLECGLRDAVSFTKGCYIGQEVIARLDTYGKTRRHLARVESPVPVPAPSRLSMDGSDAGMLTSMTELPFSGLHLGLAVIRDDLAAAGQRLQADTNGTFVHVAGPASGA